MQDAMIVHEDNLPAISDDSLLMVAEQAEKRIEAVIKIKQMALKVTNPGDWVDQNGKPYLYASGSEKIANLFNVSWQIDEPTCDTEPDGHFTFTFRGTFRIHGRSIAAEGSRSSKDPFFKKYNWVDGERIEKPISDIDRRDVRMAALTNLLGNGITRVLGIRNLSYDDLSEYAGITKEMIEKIDYGKKGKGKSKPPLKQPSKKTKKTNGKAFETQEIETLVLDLEQKDGEKDGKPWTMHGIKGEGDIIYKTFSDTFADLASAAMQSESRIKISFKSGQYGNSVIDLEIIEGSEEGL